MVSLFAQKHCAKDHGLTVANVTKLMYTQLQLSRILTSLSMCTLHSVGRVYWILML